MKINFIGVNRLKTGGQYINFAIEKSKPGKPVTPPEEKYLVLDKGKLDVNKLK
jgi:hypothetical protein